MGDPAACADHVRVDFAFLLAADREQGIRRELEDYLRHPRFAGFEEVIADEFLAADAPGSLEGDAGHGNDDADERPETIGHYRVLRQLGRGGQGAVYLAEDQRLERHVALKVLIGLGSLRRSDVARLNREALAASRLSHPGICAVYEANLRGAIPYIAMQYIVGHTLARGIACAQEFRQDWPLGQAGPDSGTTRAFHPEDRVSLVSLLQLFEKMAYALHAAHDAGIVHRDIKPGNIMITAGGEPVILDFGLARLEGSDPMTMTRQGDVFGTPAYMSPEQIAGSSSEVDRRTDVWSLGATLFECATLRRPFEHATRDGLLQSITLAPTPDARRWNRNLPWEVSVVIETALHKRREERYATALDFAEDLRRIREQLPIRARRTPVIRRWARALRRRPVTAISVAALLIAGCLFAYIIKVGPEVDAHRARLRARKVELLLQDAAVTIQDRVYSDARAILRDVLMLDPDSAEAVAELAIVELEDRRPEEALRQLDGNPYLEARYPDLARIRALALRALNRDGGQRGSSGTLGPPDSALGHYVQGIIALHEGRFGDEGAAARAYEQFSQAILGSSEAGLGWTLKLCAAAAESGDAARARIAAAVIRERLGDSAAALSMAARALGQSDADIDEAMRLIDQAIAIRSDWALLHNMRGVLLRKKGHLDDALASYERAIALRPDVARFHMNVGILWQSRGDTAKAIDAFRSAVAADPSDSLILGALAAALYYGGRQEESESYMRRAISADPKNATAHHNLGLLLDWRGEAPEAIGHFRAALDGDPRRRDSIRDLGSLLRRTGNVDAAIELHRAAIERFPSDAEFEFELGRDHVQKGTWIAALEALTSSASRDGDRAGAWKELGYILGYGSNHSESIESLDAYEQLARLAPGDRMALAALPDCLAANGRFEDALRQVRQGLERENLDADIRTHLESRVPLFERFARSAAALDRAASGDVSSSSPVENIILGKAAFARGCHVMATRLFGRAIESGAALEPWLRRSALHHGAMTALLASLGEGKDPPRRVSERLDLREVGLRWLNEEVVALVGEATAGGEVLKLRSRALRARGLALQFAKWPVVPAGALPPLEDCDPGGIIGQLDPLLRGSVR